MRSGILVVTVRRRNLTYYEVNPINRGLFSNSNIIILGFVVWWRIAVSVCLITSVTGLFTDPLQNMAAADDSRYYNGKSPTSLDPYSDIQTCFPHRFSCRWILIRKRGLQQWQDLRR